MVNHEFASDKVKKKDEYYTKDYAIFPIIRYLEKGRTIWCPFDKEESNYVKIFRAKGFKVILSHIEDGKDFFKYTPQEHYDYVISNPPYSLKTEVLNRLFSFDKPFAMLVGVVGLFESQKRFDMFKKNVFEVLYLNRRVSFMKSFDSNKCELNPPFSSVYLCSKILPKQICFEEIIKCQKQLD